MFYVGVGIGNWFRCEYEDFKCIGILGGFLSKFFLGIRLWFYE